MDRRRVPANAYVAADWLRSTVEAPRYSSGRSATIKLPFANLLDAPNGKRDRQLLGGAGITVIDDRDGYAFVQSEKDDYVGYVLSADIGDASNTTHFVTALSSTIYSQPDFKSQDLTWVPMGAELTVTAQDIRFAKTDHGWIPNEHISSVGSRPTDPVTVAEMFLHTPYLWGGNTAQGIDCSGLVQTAAVLCGYDCPADSDQQLAEFGHRVPKDDRYQRGDLLFWKGHVAWVYDDTTLLHANAYHMKTAFEPIETAIKRIQSQGDGPVIGHKRLNRKDPT